MSSEKEFNGWTNCETWAVNMWLTNEQSIYENIAEMVADNPRIKLRHFVEERCPGLMSASLEADLIRASLDRVNWTEILDTLKDDSRNDD